jgi:hypothetical protein
MKKIIAFINQRVILWGMSCCLVALCLYLFNIPVLFAQTEKPAFDTQVDSLKQVYIGMGMSEEAAEYRARAVLRSRTQTGIMPIVNTRSGDSEQGSIHVNRNETYNAYTPQQLVDSIFVKGGACSSVSDVILTSHGWDGSAWTDDDLRGLGYFTRGTSDFEMEEGLVLSTGGLVSIEGPNAIGSSGVAGPQSTGGVPVPTQDADLQVLLPSHTVTNVSVLEFDFVPVNNVITFRYVFASEEYPNFVGSSYNDVFGFFISGPGLSGPVNGKVNLATLPTTTTSTNVVSINNVNNGNRQDDRLNCPTPGAGNNSQYYINIPGGAWAQTGCNPVPELTDYQDSVRMSMEFDGRTIVLTATYIVVPCSTYTLKLAVGNAGDQGLQSGVFLEARSFDLGESVVNYGNMIYGMDNVFRGCQNRFVVSRPTADDYPVDIDLIYGGTALGSITLPNGNPLPTTVTIPADSLSVSIYYMANTPPTGRGTFEITTRCPCDEGESFTKVIQVHDSAPPEDLKITAHPACPGENDGAVSITIKVGGELDYESSINGGTSWQFIAAKDSLSYKGLPVGDYTVLVRAFGDCKTTAHNITIGILDSEHFIWTGAVSDDWNYAGNWQLSTDWEADYPTNQWKRPTATGATIQVPRLCTNVWIPANVASGNYPVLSDTVPNYCDLIFFEFGGEVKNTHFLTYTEARVAMQLNSNQWYMISKPLRNIYTGDFYIDNPNPFVDLGNRGMLVHTMKFHIENSQTRYYVEHDWTNTFNTSDIEKSPGQGLAIFANPRNSTFQQQNQLAGTPFWFPKRDSIHYYRNPRGEIVDWTGALDRSNSGRFIYESVMDANGLVPLVHSPLVSGEHTLMGNPFMAQLDFLSFAEDNQHLIQAEYKIAYGINAGVDGVMNDLVTFKRVGDTYITTDDPNFAGVDMRYIAPMQSFIVVPNTTGGQLVADIENHTVTAPVSATNNLLRSSKNDSEKAMLYVTAARRMQRSTAVLVHWNEGDKNFRPEEDSRKLLSEKTRAALGVYLLSSDGYALDINTTNDLSEIIPIGIRTSTRGDITLYFSGMEDFGRNTTILLHDTKTGQVINISQVSEYTFHVDEVSANEPDIEGRLYLSFVTNGSTFIPDNPVNNRISVFSPASGTISILAANGEGLGVVEITDIQGRRLVRENINNSMYSQIMPAGVYIVRVMGETRKVVVK